ncbi:hypothetical protein SBOR_5015 [Sclerotinia borealis F-4128]|uniref:Uncharacterized protein n=1 Tax=Sclerotinia borealis (strain F-4128) TaxID=1432307 RepID=W9CIU1_SCLBF|nr:hypothetical protein SBOR_5015 [Sclerotinia borealis F-4128]
MLRHQDNCEAVLRRRCVSLPPASLSVYRTPLPSAPLSTHRTLLPSAPLSAHRTPLPSAPLSTHRTPLPSAAPATSTAPSQAKRVQRPYVSRGIYCIDRLWLTEIELMNIRPGYPSLLGRKTCFKKAPGQQKCIEITMGELAALHRLRGLTTAQIKAYHDRRANKLEFRVKASNLYEAELERKREEGRMLGRPDTLADEDRLVPPEGDVWQL